MPIQFQTLCLESTLNAAWNTVKSRGSAGGIDGVTIEEFTKDKVNHADRHTIPEYVRTIVEACRGKG